MSNNLLLLSFVFFSYVTFSQEQLVDYSAITIGNLNQESIPEGTIRWNGSDFQAWDESEWVTLTGERFVEDRDNNRYSIIKIGDQVWMKENLRTTHYNNGKSIPVVTDDLTWSAMSTPACSWYDDGGSGYGALYNFYAVSDTNSNNLCPSGWHVPTPDDWNILVSHLGGSSDAGGSLKESGLAHWAPPNTAGTNESGFSGIGGGYRNGLGAFFFKNQFGFWWSSKATTENEARFYGLIFNDKLININAINKKYGLSVRCVKD